MGCNVVLYTLHEQVLWATDNGRSCKTTEGEKDVPAVDKSSSEEPSDDEATTVDPSMLVLIEVNHIKDKSHIHGNRVFATCTSFAFLSHSPRSARLAGRGS